MINSAGRAWRRISALALAGILAVAGLWLAVGAGAKNGESTRQAAYPNPTYCYKTKIDDVAFRGKIARTRSHKVRFKFHVHTSNPAGCQLKFVHTECKLDRRHYKKCDSPKSYKRLHHGRHKFRVKAVYNGSGVDASAPDSYRWKVK